MFLGSALDIILQVAKRSLENKTHKMNSPAHGTCTGRSDGLRLRVLCLSSSGYGDLRLWGPYLFQGLCSALATSIMSTATAVPDTAVGRGTARGYRQELWGQTFLGVSVDISSPASGKLE